MRLILCRHGDVFARGERPVWLGAKNDPPLAAEGEEQAARLADALFRARIRPSRVLCGPARRMSGHARILARRLALRGPPVVDARLSDIDYGAWSGLTCSEVAERCGSRELDAWRRRGVWPSCGCWGSHEDAFRAAVRDFVDDAAGRYGADRTVVAVTGHGVLKCLGDLMRRRAGCRLPEAWRRVDPGHVCQLFHHAAKLHVVSWNEKPESIRAVAGPSGRR